MNRKGFKKLMHANFISMTGRNFYGQQPIGGGDSFAFSWVDVTGIVMGTNCVSVGSNRGSII